ncbi:MAG: mechanosensitive ion channel [Bacteroidetes bacterium]|nr:mechanosensitive ion channel [Bacteroidota bacterium]MBU1485909.1 mechanosensitive ion channel [Bacteroidota bacterium]MBU2269358.1 mechanosensitive ion channel [Bacteroidota bacterium]MBU2375911.1 mechanosensitive ion channel [Bacteroidota bacterium]
MCRRFFINSLLLLQLCFFAITAQAQNLSDSLIKFQLKDTSKVSLGSSDTTFNILIKRVDKYADQLNQINTQLSNGFDTLEISDDLPLIEARLNVFQNRSFDGSVVTLRFLSNFQDYFATLQKQLNKWDKQLTTYNTSLVGMQEILCSFTTDSVFRNLPADSALRDRFFTRLNALGPKWHRLDSSSNQALLKIGLLVNRVSSAQLEVSDFNDQINIGLKKLNQRTFTKEYPYIWDLKSPNFFSELKEGLFDTISINYRLLMYYLGFSYKVHIINAVFFFLLFIWLYNNKNTIVKDHDANAKTIFEQAPLASRFPILAALAVVCTIGPFFYYHPPIILDQIYLLVLMIVIGIIARRSFSETVFRSWFILTGFVFLLNVSNLYFLVYASERIVFFFLTIIVLIFSIRYYKRNILNSYPEKMEKFRYAVYAYFALLVFSIIANIFGRYSLAKIATTTAVFTMVEGLSLYVFVHIITEGIYLQMEVGKLHISQLSSYLDFKNLKNRIGNFLKFIAIILLFVFFTQNLGIFDNIFDETKNFLSQVRKIGSTSFTFGSFILFVGIIYLATVIGKVVSYFFEFADESIRKKSRKAKYSSSLLLVRLSIWVIGFLIAIAASGIPLDKITIIIGALGVGIGFGLQNIVNNVVSGLVMVFEKPIQVGDLIEVGSEVGTVRSMGIRASKILTLDGSEVIIPNGDLLSQNLINWTLSNTHKRISLEIGVAYGSDIDLVKQIFKDILEKREDVMQTPSPLILLDNFGDSSVNFRILFWVGDIDNWLIIKSILMSNIFEEFYKQGVQIPFPQRDVHIYMKDGDKEQIIGKLAPKNKSENNEN